MEGSKYTSVLSGKNFEPSSRKRGVFLYKTLSLKGDVRKTEGEKLKMFMLQLLTDEFKISPCGGRCLSVHLFVVLP